MSQKNVFIMAALAALILVPFAGATTVSYSDGIYTVTGFENSQAADLSISTAAPGTTQQQISLSGISVPITINPAVLTFTASNCKYAKLSLVSGGTTVSVVKSGDSAGNVYIQKTYQIGSGSYDLIVDLVPKGSSDMAITVSVAGTKTGGSSNFTLARPTVTGLQRSAQIVLKVDGLTIYTETWGETKKVSIAPKKVSTTRMPTSSFAAWYTWYVEWLKGKNGIL